MCYRPGVPAQAVVLARAAQAWRQAGPAVLVPEVLHLAPADQVVPDVRRGAVLAAAVPDGPAPVPVDVAVLAWVWHLVVRDARVAAGVAFARVGPVVQPAADVPVQDVVVGSEPVFAALRPLAGQVLHYPVKQRARSQKDRVAGQVVEDDSDPEVDSWRNCTTRSVIVHPLVPERAVQIDGL